MEKNERKLYFVPKEITDGEVVLFEGTETRGIMDDEEDTNWWINLRYVTACQKVFQLEVTTFKKTMGKEFFDEFTELVAKHSSLPKD